MAHAILKGAAFLIAVCIMAKCAAISRAIRGVSYQTLLKMIQHLWRKLTARKAIDDVSIFGAVAMAKPENRENPVRLMADMSHYLPNAFARSQVPKFA